MPAPLIAAAALTAIGGLMQNMMQQQAQKEALEEQRRQTAQQMAFQRETQSRDRVAQSQNQQLQTVGAMGDREQGALGNLMAALQRTQR